MPEQFYKDNRPIPTRHLSGITQILKENYFQFSGKHYLQTHGTGMGTLRHQKSQFSSNKQAYITLLLIHGRNTSVTLRGCLRGGRMTLVLGISQQADHPGAICFLYSVYIKNVVLVPSARIFLTETKKILVPGRSKHHVNSLRQEDPRTRDKQNKNGGRSFNWLSLLFNSFFSVNQTD